MKSDHRHELKTNELADWLAHLPEWIGQNQTTIIVTAAAAVVALAVFFWTTYRRGDLAREQVRLTNLVTQLPYQKAQIVQAAEKNENKSFILLPSGENLLSFAQRTKNKRMAAMALIKYAEILRTDLHYRAGEVTMEDWIGQLEKAKDGYTRALVAAKGDASLAGTAQLGIGLCEEDLSHWDLAKAAYEQLVKSDQYKGTAARAEAQHRLETMGDYVSKVTFAASPIPVTPAAPILQPNIAPAGGSRPTEANRPVEANRPAAVVPASAPAPAKSDANTSGAAGPNAVRTSTPAPSPNTPRR